MYSNNLKERKTKMIKNIKYRDLPDYWGARIAVLQALNDPDLWAEAEGDGDADVRLEAYRHTGNWEKAEGDGDADVRLEAYRHTGNWEKAEDDVGHNVRLEAYRHTGNWGKAKGDDHWRVRALAYSKLGLWGDLPKGEDDVDILSVDRMLRERAESEVGGVRATDAEVYVKKLGELYEELANLVFGDDAKGEDK